MLKEGLESLVNQYNTAIGEALIRIRNNPNGFCEACLSDKGDRHKESCPMWPLIKARAKFNSLNEDVQKTG